MNDLIGRLTRTLAYLRTTVHDPSNGNAPEWLAAQDAIVDTIAELEKHEWVGVDERRPPNDDRVRVSVLRPNADHGEPELGFYDGNVGAWLIQGDHGQFRPVDEMDRDARVTHWKPMGEPPQ